MKKAVLIAALATTMVTPAAYAEDHSENKSGFYTGLGLGRMTIDFDETNFSDESDTAWKLLAGYNFNEYFALEAAYNDFGSYEQNGVKGDLTGYSVAALAAYPVANNIKVFAKGGYFEGKDKRTFNNTKERETQSGPLLGVGVMYQVGQWDLRAEYERSEDKDEFQVTTLSMAYRF